MDIKCIFLFIMLHGIHIRMATGLRLNPGGLKAKKLLHTLTPLLVHPDLGTCYRNKKDGNMVTLPNGKDLCRVRGRNYMVTETWFDESTCIVCACMAPLHVECCQAKLIPKNMPKACKVDTAGRHSTILPIRKCMAPLAYKRPSGRRIQSQPCRDRDLHEALTGTVITHGKPGSRHRLVAIKSEKTNSKRHSGDIPSNRGITLSIPLSVHREWIRVMLKKYSLNRFHLPS